MSYLNQIINSKQLISSTPVLTDRRILFLSYTDGNERASVINFEGETFDQVWLQLNRFLRGLSKIPKYLRLDVLTDMYEMSYDEAIREIQTIPRNNYFRKGITFDSGFTRSFLSEELLGNAILRPALNHRPGFNSAMMNFDKKNLEGYIWRKYHKKEVWNIAGRPMYFFETQGFLFEEDNIVILGNDGILRGLRETNSDNLFEAIEKQVQKGTDYLSSLMQTSGKFIYGYYPTYDFELRGYNTVRHFSSLYAWTEAVGFLKNKEQLRDIKQGLKWGFENLSIEREGAIFLVERIPKGGMNIKLGAQALALIALCKYQEISGDDSFTEYYDKIIKGISTKFINSKGSSVHILDENLELKKEFEIVYYDGEAVLGLVRTFTMTKRSEYYELAKKMFQVLIDKGYEKYHDHWLSYATNEMLIYSNEKKYYEFGLKNAFDNLSFIEHRDTAYPTMLELLMAAIKMIDKLLKDPKYSEDQLVSSSEIAHLKAVARIRAIHELNTGINYPELAMFMKSPEKITGGFMTRHDKFRMRIDDQQHFLSGLIHYYDFFFDDTTEEAKMRLTGNPKNDLIMVKEEPNIPKEIEPKIVLPEKENVKVKAKKDLETRIPFAKLDQLFDGYWFKRIHHNKKLTNVEYSAIRMKTADPHKTMFISFSPERRKFINQNKVVNWKDGNEQVKPFINDLGLLITEEPLVSASNTPQFIVPNTWEFFLKFAEYARSIFSGPAIAITGSAGKSTTRLILSQLLNKEKLVENVGNHNVRFAIPLYLSKLIVNPDILNLEVSLNALNSYDTGNMAPLVSPTIAIVTSIGAAHLSTLHTTMNVAKIKGKIFEGLQEGGIAIINKDMGSDEYSYLRTMAEKRTEKVLDYSLKDTSASMFVKNIEHEKTFDFVTVHFDGRDFSFKLKYSGKGMIQNAMASLLALTGMGKTIDDYLDELGKFNTLPKTLEYTHYVLSDKGNVDVIDDTHNASVPAMKNAIEVFNTKSHFYNGPKILVLGQVADLGDQASELHKELFEIALQSEATFILGYGEHFKELFEENSSERVFWSKNMNDLLKLINKFTSNDSLIVLKGSITGSDFHTVSPRLKQIFNNKLVGSQVS